MSTTTAPASASIIPTPSLLPPFSSDFGPRPLPQAAKKPYADLGSSSIRSPGYEHRMSLPHPPLPAGSASTSGTGIKVVNSSNLRLETGRKGFSVNSRRSSSFVVSAGGSGSGGSSTMGLPLAGPGPSSRSASYGQESLAGQGPLKRKLFYAVADGHQKGIYETWAEAEEQIKGHPAPQWKTFKTRLAAESYILSASPFATTAPADADTGAYDMQLEYPTPNPSTPTYEAPLHERLQRDFPSTTPKSAPSPPLADLQPPRPHFARGSGSRSASPTSPMKRSSPLRQEVTDDEAERERERSGLNGEESDSVSSLTEAGESATIGKKQKKRSSFMARFSSGLLSPPTSPEAAAQGTKSFRVESIERPVLAPPIVLPPTDVSRPNSRASSRSTMNRTSMRPAAPRSPSTGDVEAAAAYEQRPESIRSVSSSSVASRHNRGSVLGPKPPSTPTRGLWADATPPLSPPLSPPNLKYGHHDRASSPSGSDADIDEFGATPKSNAPKFSRSAMKKQGVLLPVSAKQASLNNSRPSSPALSRSPSFASLNRKASHTSLNSIGSFGSFGVLRDKLSAVQIAEEQPRRADGENVKPRIQGSRARPNMSSRSVSKESVTSDASALSFATAHEDVLPVTPKKTPNGSQDGHQLGDPEKLSPIPSNASVSDDLHGSSRSDATHTQSEACGGKYGEDRQLGKKKSFKRLLRALGFSKMDESKTKEKTEWERRSSA